MAERPFEAFHPPAGFSFPKRRFGDRERSCQAKWFVDYPFLHYDTERDVLLCHTCVVAVQQKKILHSKRPDPAFVSFTHTHTIRISNLESLCITVKMFY